MTYLASISLITQTVVAAVANNNDTVEATTLGPDDDDQQQNNNTYISILIIVKLLPNVIFMPLGGIMADTYDRLHVQIVLDVLSALLVFLFVWSSQTHSLLLLYVATFLQEVFAGLYGPSNSSILPQLIMTTPQQQHKPIPTPDITGNGEEKNTRTTTTNNTISDSNSDEELKKATTLYALCWSLMAALGSAVGGVLVATFGIQGCFIIDAITYLLSALILQWGVHGNFKVTTTTTQSAVPTTDTTGNEAEKAAAAENVAYDHPGRRLQRRRSSSSSVASCVSSSHTLIISSGGGCPPTATTICSITKNVVDDNDDDTSTGISRSSNEDQQSKKTISATPPTLWMLYLEGIAFAIQNPILGSYVLLKGSMAIAFGAADVLNVRFSARGNANNASLTSLKLGAVFGCVGLGCILGSVVTDTGTSLSRPLGLARVCLLGFVCNALGFYLLSLFPDNFDMVLISVIIRTCGCSTSWITSSLLLQKFTPIHLLGRIQSLDTGIAYLGEAVSAYVGGVCMDEPYNVSPEYLSFLLATVAVCFFFVWSPLAFKGPNTETISN